MIKPGDILQHKNHTGTRLKILFINEKHYCKALCMKADSNWDTWYIGRAHEWYIDLDMWVLVPKPHKSHLPEWL